jgi:hypothetical protein
MTSHYDFIVDMGVMMGDLINGRYSTDCPTHIPWYQRLTIIDCSLIILFTSLFGVFYTKGRIILLNKFRQYHRCDESNLNRASEVTCQVIARCFSMLWTSIIIFYIPSCSVLKDPTSAWQFLDAKEHPLRMTPVYCFGVSMYLWHLISIVYIDERRKDFIILIIHHTVTLLSILMSYTIKFYDMGLLIYFLHDFNDPFLELGKVFHYISVDRKGRLNQTYARLSDVSMVFFALSWIPTRLYLFPLRGIYALSSTSRNSCDFVPISIGTNLLYILYFLNFLWFFMLSRAIFNRIILGGFTDETMDDIDADKISKVVSNRRKSSGFTSDIIAHLDEVQKPNGKQE